LRRINMCDPYILWRHSVTGRELTGQNPATRRPDLQTPTYWLTKPRMPSRQDDRDQEEDKGLLDEINDMILLFRLAKPSGAGWQGSNLRTTDSEIEAPLFRRVSPWRSKNSSKGATRRFPVSLARRRHT
jgi:hypothetical protein